MMQCTQRIMNQNMQIITVCVCCVVSPPILSRRYGFALWCETHALISCVIKRRECL